MKIKTITCHEVYNHGASLQEYALLKYLETLGHEVETIHYKPPYLSNHFKLWLVSNDFFNKNIILKSIYLLLKLPQKLINLKRKRKFDEFSTKYIKSTKELYRSNEELKLNVPEADAYICGSDQIWNSFFENGKDPAFYLDFVPGNKLKISYAASFAIDSLEDEVKNFVKEKVSKLDFISVRESSGKEILNNLGFTQVHHVLDPVFLLEVDEWSNLIEKPIINKDYIFVYDFDSNPLIKIFVKKQAKKYNYKIVSVNFNIKYADYNFYLAGPQTFISLVRDAKFVVSNSFHAVAFSVIFKKQFTVFDRFEKINTRMRDFVSLFDIKNVLITTPIECEKYDYEINYNKVDLKRRELVNKSKKFILNSLKN
uniref:polysaccharide pyruvyl transferase family protein n=1 Tax=Mariniflexile sp. TaxID=1979402 RepID=UPI004048915B